MALAPSNFYSPVSITSMYPPHWREPMDATTKNEVIRLLILQKMADGMPAPEAIDAVCGAGTYKRLAGDLWAKLREQQGLPTE